MNSNETAHFALRRKGFDGFGGNDPVWSTIPTTLSDHQLVGAELALTQLFVPGRYHPTWPHEVTFRVVSQDSTGISDCWGCGQLDTMRGSLASASTQRRTWISAHTSRRASARTGGRPT